MASLLPIPADAAKGSPVVMLRIKGDSLRAGAQQVLAVGAPVQKLCSGRGDGWLRYSLNEAFQAGAGGTRRGTGPDTAQRRGRQGQERGG